LKYCNRSRPLVHTLAVIKRSPSILRLFGNRRVTVDGHQESAPYSTVARLFSKVVQWKGKTINKQEALHLPTPRTLQAVLPFPGSMQGSLHGTHMPVSGN